MYIGTIRFEDPVVKHLMSLKLFVRALGRPVSGQTYMELDKDLAGIYNAYNQGRRLREGSLYKNQR